MGPQSAPSSKTVPEPGITQVINQVSVTWASSCYNFYSEADAVRIRISQSERFFA